MPPPLFRHKTCKAHSGSQSPQKTRKGLGGYSAVDILATLREELSSKNSFATRSLTNRKTRMRPQPLFFQVVFLCLGPTFLFPLQTVLPFSSPLIPIFSDHAPYFPAGNWKYSILTKIPSFKPRNKIKKKMFISFLPRSSGRSTIFAVWGHGFIIACLWFI